MCRQPAARERRPCRLVRTEFHNQAAALHRSMGLITPAKLCKGLFPELRTRRLSALADAIRAYQSSYDRPVLAIIKLMGYAGVLILHGRQGLLFDELIDQIVGNSRMPARSRRAQQLRGVKHLILEYPDKIRSAVESAVDCHTEHIAREKVSDHAFLQLVQRHLNSSSGFLQHQRRAPGPANDLVALIEADMLEDDDSLVRP
jgi:hypothetical protein